MGLGDTSIGKAFNFINDPLGILPADVYKYMFDPAGIFASQPDIPNAGGPDPETQVMKSVIGMPIPDLCGTGKVTGNLLFFGNERNEKVYSESAGGGGKGGSPEPEPQVTGFKYFMSWGVGICQCPDDPVDVLYAIYKNDDVEQVWPIFDTLAEEEMWEGLPLPVSGGQETIVLDGIGSMVFSYGTNDQMPIAKVATIITDSTLNTPYRYLCWAFFDDCFIGEYNRTPTYKFILKKIPKITAMPDRGNIGTYDCNPSHAIYYILNVLSGLPVSWLDADDFNVIAETLGDEKRGISILLDSQQSALNYIENINGHVDNILRYGSDGQFHPKLIRADYDVNGLPLIDESVMLDNPSFSRGSWIDTVNELKVQYSEIIDPNISSINRITNEYVEVLRKGIPFARLTNEYVEVLRSGIPSARLTNEYVEVLREGLPSARFTNEYVEILREA